MRPVGTFSTLIVGIVLGAAGTLLLLSRVPLDKRDTAAIAAPAGQYGPPAPATSATGLPPGFPAPAPEPAAAPGSAPAGAQDAAAAPAAATGEPRVPGAGKASGDSLAGMRPTESSGSGGLVASGSGSALLIPVAGIKSAQLRDTYNQPRGAERMHEALDIPAPIGTPVYAVADGRVAKLFNSKPGGLTIYQFDPAEKYSYYYAHLDRYASTLKEGQQVKRGEVIGYVGATGNANPAAPHLHFAMFELGPEKNWWQGKPLNPYPLLGHQ